MFVPEPSYVFLVSCTSVLLVLIVRNYTNTEECVYGFFSFAARADCNQCLVVLYHICKAG